MPSLYFFPEAHRRHGHKSCSQHPPVSEARLVLLVHPNFFYPSRSGREARFCGRPFPKCFCNFYFSAILNIYKNEQTVGGGTKSSFLTNRSQNHCVFCIRTGPFSSADFLLLKCYQGHQKKTSAAQVVILSINITQLERMSADAPGRGPARQGWGEYVVCIRRHTRYESW